MLIETDRPHQRRSPAVAAVAKAAVRLIALPQVTKAVTSIGSRVESSTFWYRMILQSSQSPPYLFCGDIEDASLYWKTKKVAPS